MTEENQNQWHKNHKTWKKINEFLFKNSTMSDCAFLFKVENTTVKIPAHKYVLGGYSPEFYNLFYLLKSDSDEIPINDVAIEDFLKFLEFIYTEKTEINLDNFEALIMLAHRYSVESFKDFCGDFLQTSVNGENVLHFMNKYSSYGLPNFELTCLKIINKNRLVFEDPLFYEISINTLTTILKSENLNGFKEITIFKGVDKWSEVFCHKNNQEINSENKRLALGEALKFIRFGAMTNEEFSSCTLNLENSILNHTEMVKVFQFIATNGKSNCPYSGEKRLGQFQNCNWTKGIPITTQKLTKNYSYIQFKVNEPIQLIGFGIFGRVDLLNEQNPEKLMICLFDQNFTVLLEDIVEIRYDGTDKIYELLLNNSKWLDANEEYYFQIQSENSGEIQNFTTESNVEENKIINVDGVIFTISYCPQFWACIIYNNQ